MNKLQSKANRAYLAAAIRAMPPSRGEDARAPAFQRVGGFFPDGLGGDLGRLRAKIATVSQKAAAEKPPAGPVHVGPASKAPDRRDRGLNAAALRGLGLAPQRAAANARDAPSAAVDDQTVRARPNPSRIGRAMLRAERGAVAALLESEGSRSGPIAARRVPEPKGPTARHLSEYL